MLPLPHAIPLAGASNLRDLGGWPAQNRAVRRHLLFRAPALADLTADDAARIAALGIATVIDLRGLAEAAHTPVNIPGARRLALPIEPTVGASLKDILRTGQLSGHASEADIAALLCQAYRAYALSAAPRYRALFETLLEGETPVLIHCSAGKDRTGFAAALILTALGVAEDAVMQDYLATNRLWRRENVRHFALPAPVAEALLSAREAYLAAAFAAAEARGSLQAYLTHDIGLDAPARARLAERFLAPAAPPPR